MPSSSQRPNRQEDRRRLLRQHRFQRPLGPAVADGYQRDRHRRLPVQSLDPVHQAKAAALADGAEITVWVLAPDVALALSTTKEFNPGETSDATSNRGLLDANGVSDGTLLAGLPVLVSTDVGAGNAWGLGSSQVLVVQRTGTKVNPSTDSVFDYDAVQVRATAPVLFGFPNPAGVADLRHRLVHPRRCRPVTRPGPSGPLRPGDSP